MKDKHLFPGILLPALLGIPIGAITGGITALFGILLIRITDLRSLHPFFFLPFLAPAGVLIVAAYRKYGAACNKGMNLIFEVGHGTEETIPLRLIPLIISGTWLTHLFGASAGREGVAVQIGATVSHNIGQKLGIKKHARTFLVSGMAAGFAGLFRTPLAAILFAMEVLTAGRLRTDALIPSITAAFTASTVSGLLGLEKFTFPLTSLPKASLLLALKLIPLGILFGLTGAAFAYLLSFLKKKASAFQENPVRRILYLALLLTPVFLLLHKGRYSGLGTNLISASLNGETIYVYDWALKLLLTCLSLAAGFQGGEVTPLFAIGASLGCILSPLFGLPLPLTAALGYAAVFGAATNTLLAPILIGAEVFGFDAFPLFFVVCAISYASNHEVSIYSLQKKSA